MKILALEFSSPQRSAAVVRTNEFRAPPSELKHSSPHGVHPCEFIVSEVVETGPGANAPLVMIEEALRQGQLEREQIDCLAVGIGPGSYTGIRAAISIAQGWQLARGVKLLGIGSADCIAEQAWADGISGPIRVVIDAQREECYVATYEPSDTNCREVEPLQIVTRAELHRQLLETDSVFIGPEVTKWFPSGRIVFPHAAVLGRLAWSRTDFIAGEKLEPIYLRETKFVKAPPPRIVP